MFTLKSIFTRPSRRKQAHNARLHAAAREARVRRVGELVASGAYESDFDVALAMPAVGAGLARAMADAHAAEDADEARARPVPGTLPADDDATRVLWDKTNVPERFETL